MVKFSEETRFAIDVAKEAGARLLEVHSEPHDLEFTTRQHFRTEADRESDALIRKRIQEAYPEHGINSEEDKAKETGSLERWVVDPIDGTIGFTTKITDHWSVCISLVRGDQPVLGVTYAPQRKELYVAELWTGAYCNNQRIFVSEEDPNRVLMGMDSGKVTKTFNRKSIAPFIERALEDKGISCPICTGCASVPIALTAKENYHAYMALSLEPWDMAAGVLIAREAGARVTSVDGREWNINEPSILIANPRLHEKLVEYFKDQSREYVKSGQR